MSVFKYLNSYKKEAVFAPVFKMTEALLELFVPLAVAYIIDTVIPSGNKKGAFLASTVLLALAAVGLLLSVTAQYFSAKAAVGFASKLRTVLFSHIMSLSYTELDTLGISGLITRMTSDINQVQTGVNLTLRLLLRSPFIVLGAMIMAFTIDVKSALIFAVIIPVLAVIVFVLMAVTVPKFKNTQKRLDSVMLLVRENLSGVRVIRAFCKEKSEVNAFDEANGGLTLAQKSAGRLSALLNPLTLTVLNVGIIILIETGALRVETGILTQGAVVALYNYMSQILVELIKLSDLIVNISKSLACAKRIEGVLETEAGNTEVSSGGKSEKCSADTAVEFVNVSMRYKESMDDALSNISFKAQKGETIGIIGATGSGKSTLVSLMPRFYPVSGGEIYIDSENISDYKTEELRRKFGFVPQKSVLFSGTVRENLQMGDTSLSDSELIVALKDAQAYDYINEKGGLDFVLKQNGRNLSGGQRQRLSVARALARKPKILVLDDSSSALDYATERALRKAISQLEYKPTVFKVSQRVSAVADSNRILVMDDGKLVGNGSHNELLNSCPVYKEIYASQSGKEAAGNE